MRVDLFDFDLPDDRIALRPASPRDAARLLHIPATAGLGHHRVSDLSSLLRPGDALVVNDTRVIPARLRGRRERDGVAAQVEIMLHRRIAPDRWEAFARPAKRLAPGDHIRFGSRAASAACELDVLDASVEIRGASGETSLRFSLSGPFLDEAIGRLGEMPLPPYIAGRRPADAADAHDYQTVYARTSGAVAAPTAGLHLTETLMADLRAAGLTLHTVTLHVGAGTFLPVKADDTADHRMHAEWGEVTEDTADALNAVRRRGGRIVAVGTTSLRLLESAADARGRVQAFAGETDIFITPGYCFRAVDALMTNFHLPRSTLFMLVAAFAGLDRTQAVYRAAIDAGYRFYSYGDACLIERSDTA